FADKMAVMNHGVIEQYGSASELYFHPSSKFVADFLGGGSYLNAQRISELEFETSLGVVEAKPQTEIEFGSACELLLRPQHIQASYEQDSAISVLEQQFMGDHCRYVI
ncbi:ABC transporter ATP-binding protein, partial [Vibrio lentus]|nr:ABC transporter ATP-binding protein [Vibrio lentus]